MGVMEIDVIDMETEIANGTLSPSGRFHHDDVTEDFVIFGVDCGVVFLAIGY